MAFEILPRTLSSTRVTREITSLPLALIELRAAGEALFSPKGGVPAVRDV